jgi:maltooligosyltrehalose trehalohydrolase
MGEEYGETNPFQYFVSHGDRKLIEAVSAGRQEEFAAFGWAGAIPDPASESTFANSRLDRAKLDEPKHASMVELYRDLIAVRKRSEVRGPRSEGRARESRVMWRDDVITIERATEDGRRMIVVFNCSDREQEIALPEGSWQLVLSTDDAKYGGRVEADVTASVGAVSSSRPSRRRASGDEWKTDDLGPRTLDLGPWTAIVYTTGSNQ